MTVKNPCGKSRTGQSVEKVQLMLGFSYYP